jgi:dolichol-phosphate mannosyltransferase
MSPPRICFVIPTYNEADNIRFLIKGIMENLPGYYVQIYLVDDGSTDGTRESVPPLDVGFDVEVINRGRRSGFGSALSEGLKTALAHKPSLIVTMDADLSHDPCEIPNLLSKSGPWIVVLGSRYIEGGSREGFSFPRRLASRAANWLAERLVVKGISDCTSGFRCYSPDVIEAILPSLNSIGYDIQVESIFHARRLGYAVVETPIHFRKRLGGKSKLGPIEILRFAKLLYRLKFYQ